MTWQVIVNVTARAQLDAVRDQRVKSVLAKTIARLREDPDKQGKPMKGKLVGYRSLRAVGQRYRILYRVDAGAVIVVVVFMGIRREGSRDDVYAHAQRLVDLNQLETEGENQQ